MRHRSRRDELSSESGLLSGDLDAGIDAEAMGPLALPFRRDIVKPVSRYRDSALHVKLHVISRKFICLYLARQHKRIGDSGLPLLSPVISQKLES